MTPTAMADLSERARRVLDLQAKMIAYFADAVTDYDGSAMAEGEQPRIPPSCRDMRDMDRFARDSADLIRELLEENERLRDGIKQIRAAVKSEQMHYLKRYQNEKSAYREGGSDVADAIMSAVDVMIAHITVKADDIASRVVDMEPVEHNTRDAGPTPLRGRVTRRTE